MTFCSLDGKPSNSLISSGTTASSLPQNCPRMIYSYILLTLLPHPEHPTAGHVKRLTSQTDAGHRHHPRPDVNPSGCTMEGPSWGGTRGVRGIEDPAQRIVTICSQSFIILTLAEPDATRPSPPAVSLTLGCLVGSSHFSLAVLSPGSQLICHFLRRASHFFPSSLNTCAALGYGFSGHLLFPSFSSV